MCVKVGIIGEVRQLNTSARLLGEQAAGSEKRGLSLIRSKYHTIDGHGAGLMELIAKPSFSVVADMNFQYKPGKAEGTITTGAKVAAKWTFSKKVKRHGKCILMGYI
jgi:hypothetical protein